jgi:predicted phage baseplate assembly protein
MPLPLPSLDTRRFDDLVEEARVLVPRHAPGWTDHNLHDPGITLVELLAWLVELDIYRTDRITDRHRRAFLELLGVRPEPPRPARVPISFALRDGEGPLVIPGGTACATHGADGATVPFATQTRLVAHPTQIAAVQTWDGRAYTDVTRLWHDRLPFPAFGERPSGFEAEDPVDQPALLIGLDRPLIRRRPAALWLAFRGGGAATDELHALSEDTAADARRCRPARPQASCGSEPEPAAPKPPALPIHALELAWEYFDAGSWKAARAQDPTRGFVLDGLVRLLLPATMDALNLGAIAAPLYYLRVRARAGTPDESPVVLDVAVNVVEAAQRSPARTTFALPPDASVPAPLPPVGRRRRLEVEFDTDGRTTGFGPTASRRVPKVRILDVRAPSGGIDGRLTATLVLAGFATGEPLQQLELSPAAVADGELLLWTREPDGRHLWSQRRTLEAAGPREDVFVLDAQAALIRFGDGRRGRVPARGTPVMLSYDVTQAGGGNVPLSKDWRLSGVDDELNGALFGRPPSDVEGELARIESRRAASGGADGEEVPQAFGRASEILWAHERLLELAPEPGGTLDGLDPVVVRARRAPARAVTTPDFERLALSVPGRRIRRARAWAGIDARLPALHAPGTVTVVVVPGHPADRPQPTKELLGAVRRFLALRKTLGTRLVVCGPEYVEVSVVARVRVVPGADEAATVAAVGAKLTGSLDPLSGGSAGRGWPFGRDVYRTELLALVDRVAGVEHVDELELRAEGSAETCESVCIGPTQLVVSGAHTVEAVT